MNKLLKNIVSLCFGTLIAVLLLELFLRVYNPWEPRLQGDKIVLPKNTEYVFHSKGIQGVDSTVLHKKNELGFRGINPPDSFNEMTSLVFVGGSTTECTACGENEDWPAVTQSILNKNKNEVWVNNAGLDGHSTFGHLLLLEDYLVQLKPSYIAFLVGVNDVGRKDLASFEKFHLKKGNKNWKQTLVSYSVLAQLIVQFKQSKEAIDLDLGHKNKPFNQYHLKKMKWTQINQEVEKEAAGRLAFNNRLNRIVTICLNNGITPIFITQPTVMGAADTLEPNLNFKEMEIRHFNGQTFDQILNSYNQVTRDLCQEKNLLCIDLWRKLPKRSKYFYDEVHFTKEGCKKVGEIVGNELSLYLNN